MLKIKATRMKGKDLKTGDLFSTGSQFYWDHRDPKAVGEKVYLRTDVPCPPEQEEETVFKIEVIPSKIVICEDVQYKLV